MPRPTAAQFLYGALTVVSATLAMLLLSDARSGAGIAVIAVVALASGLLAALAATRATSRARRRTPGVPVPGTPDEPKPHREPEGALCAPLRH